MCAQTSCDFVRKRVVKKVNVRKRVVAIFPCILKLSYVTPILKSGNLSNALKYRPISVQSHILKLFESLTLKCIQPMVNGILMEEQYGFRPGHSTLTCNLVITSLVYDAFKNHGQVDVIYTDFKKAFDSVSHEPVCLEIQDLVNLS